MLPSLALAFLALLFCCWVWLHRGNLPICVLVVVGWRNLEYDKRMIEMRTDNETKRDGPQQERTCRMAALQTLETTCLHLSDRWSLAVVINNRHFWRNWNLFSYYGAKEPLSCSGLFRISERNFRDRVKKNGFGCSLSLDSTELHRSIKRGLG